MKQFKRRTFTRHRSYGKAEFADFKLEECEFRECVICNASALNKPLDRPVIRNIRLKNCKDDRSFLYGAIMREVVVDGLDTKGHMPRIMGTVYDHVTLKGKIDRLWITSYVGDESQQGIMDEANAKYYENVDWALDISHIDSKELDIRGVPATLVRYDPELQGIVTRETALKGEWKSLNFQRPGWFPTTIGDVITYGYPGAVLVVCKREPRRKQLLEDLKMLRKEGIVEPA